MHGSRSYVWLAVAALLACGSCQGLSNAGPPQTGADKRPETPSTQPAVEGIGVVSNVREALDPSLVAIVRQTPGVAMVRPWYTARLVLSPGPLRARPFGPAFRLPFRRAKPELSVLGVDPDAEAEFGEHSLAEGSRFLGPDGRHEIVVQLDLAGPEAGDQPSRSLLGKQVVLEGLDGRTAAFRIVGVLAARHDRGADAYVRADDLRELLPSGGRLFRIGIALAPGADRQAVLKQLRDRIRPPVDVPQLPLRDRLGSPVDVLPLPPADDASPHALSAIIITNQPFPDKVVRQLTSSPHVTAWTGLRTGPIKPVNLLESRRLTHVPLVIFVGVEKESVLAMLDSSTQRHPHSGTSLARYAHDLRKLKAKNGVLITGEMHRIWNLEVGDTFLVEGSEGNVELRISGFCVGLGKEIPLGSLATLARRFLGSAAGRPVIVVGSAELGQRAFGFGGKDMLFIRLDRPERIAAYRKHVEPILQEWRRQGKWTFAEMWDFTRFQASQPTSQPAGP